MLSRRLFSWLAASFMTLAFLGCGEEEKPSPAASPEIVSFTSSTDSITSGEAATLSWQTKNATSVSIVDAQGAALDLGDAQPAAGSVSVTPVEDATYELIATNGDGESVTASASIRVGEPIFAPTVESFTASPAELPFGGDLTLSWTTSNADRVTITDGAGAPIDLRGAEAAAGEVTINARASTTYRLVASGAGGEAAATAAVEVHGAPTVALSGPSAAVAPGQNARLSWTTSDADQVKVHSGGTVIYEGNEASGSATVTPQTTTVYVIEAVGPGGEANASTEIRVKPAVANFAVLDEAPVRAGDAVTVSWQLEGATSAVISNGAGFRYEIPSGELESGTAPLPTGPSGAFVLSAHSGSLLTEARAWATISLAPRINALSAAPGSVTASGEFPAEVELGWEMEGAARFLLEAIPGGPVDSFGLSARVDGLTVEITETTTFRMTALNEFGQHVADAEVHAFPAPTATLFAVRPSVAGAGETVEIAWETDDAASIRIEKDGIDLGIDPTEVDGTFTDTVMVESTYVLFATNSAGFEVEFEPFVVQIGDPQIVDFVASPEVVGTGTPLTFSWQNLGGQDLTITDAAGSTVCSTTNLAEIPEGSCQIAAPGVGDHEYTLHLTNGLGTTVTSSVTVESTDGPIIDLFTASSEILTVGEETTLSWQVRDDAAGATPAISLEDGDGNAVDVSGTSASDGSVALELDTTGLHTFTLVASTNGTTASSAVVTIDVRGVPSIDEALASPTTVDTQGGTVASPSTITWTSQNGYDVELFESNGGTPTGAALYSSTDPADAQAGSFAVTPVPGLNEYLLVVSNGAGATAQTTLAVVADAAEVLSFTAAPAQQLVGAPVTLSWDTRYADSVEVDPAIYTPLSNAFVDISGSPTAVDITPASATALDSSNIPVTFPEGFTFPYDGLDRTGVTVNTNGFLSFASSTSIHTTNAALPTNSSSRQQIHIAPFWDDLDGENGPTLGTMWTDHGVDADGAWFIVQWKDWAAWGDDHDLNFQVMLRENGVFEIRYGTMVSLSSSDDSRARGDSATIGWQNTTGTEGVTISHNTEFSDWLSDTGWRVYQRLPGSGTMDVTLDETTTYTLVASNDYSSDEASTTVEIFDEVSIGSTAYEPDLPQVDEPFTISWTTVDAFVVEVLDDGGSVIHTAPEDERASGSLTLTESSEGSYTYTVRATGLEPTDVQTEELSIYVFQPFSLDSFEASTETLQAGDSVILSWATTGGANMTLTANGSPIDLTGYSVASDSFADTPTEDTTYVFSVENAPAGAPPETLTATLHVAVEQAWFDTLEASPSQVLPGGSATLSWETTNADYVTIEPSGATFTVTDTTGTVAYLDVAAMPDSQLLSTSTTGDGWGQIDFPAGFVFPYGGENHTSVRAVTNGFLNFNGTTTTSYSPSELPSSSDPNVHLAPFWDDTDLAPVGEIHWALGSDVEGDFLAIEWKDLTFWGNTSVPGLSLNFQVILRPDGAFEYRYGAMNGVPGDVDHDQDRADGGFASIGFQNLDGSEGTSLSWATPVAGGLSNRAWRIDPPANPPADGSITVTPDETTTYTVCAHTGDYTNCKEVTVLVLAAGQVVINEVMVAPSNGSEWFEIRNTTPYPIDVDGWEIASDSADTPVTIQHGGPLVVEPGSVLVFAQSAAGVPADHVYGPGIDLADSGSDELSLHSGGMQIDRMSWDGNWAIPAGISIFFDGSYFADETSNDTVSTWCFSTETYDGTNLGSPGAVGHGCRFETEAYDVDLASGLGFIDISSTGQSLSSANVDTGTQTVSGGIGFAMPFFGDVVTDLLVSSNGFVSFDTSTASETLNDEIPDSGSPNGGIVAAFWDDMTSQTGSSVHTELRTVDGQQVRLVQWTGTKRWNNTGAVTFQVQLWENGDIATAYKDLSWSGSSAENIYRGSSATLGIESVAADHGVEFSYESPVVNEGMTILYRRK